MPASQDAGRAGVAGVSAVRLRRKQMTALKRFTHGVSWVLVGIGSVLVGLMALHVSLEVISRFVLNLPLPGTVEIVARYYMVSVIFLPLAYGQMTRAHFQADLLERFLPEGFWRVMGGLSDLVIAVLAAAFVWRTGLAAIEATEVGEHVQTAIYTLPTWPSRWLPPIGFAALCVVAVAQLAARFSTAEEHVEHVQQTGL